MENNNLHVCGIINQAKPPNLLVLDTYVNMRKYIFGDSVDIELIHSRDDIVADYNLIKQLLNE